MPMRTSALKTPMDHRSCGRRIRLYSVAFAAMAIALLAGVLLSAGPARSATPAKPNFVVIMTDDQTVGELKTMANTRSLIGSQGVSFDQFITSYSLCCPSRTTFMTGQYAHNHGVRG